MFERYCFAYILLLVASAYEDLKGDLEMPTGTLIKKVQILYAHMADEGMF